MAWPASAFSSCAWPDINPTLPPRKYHRRRPPSPDSNNPLFDFKVDLTVKDLGFEAKWGFEIVLNDLNSFLERFVI